MKHDLMHTQIYRVVFALLATVVALIGIQPAPAAAQTDYPTVQALAEAIIPAADPVELARRLRGVTDIPPPPVDPPVRQPGERESLWVLRLGTGEDVPIPATLLAVGAHVYVWAEDGSGIGTEQAAALVAAFDADVYEQVRDLWGSEPLPGVDGDPRTHILFATGLGGVVAYYAPRHAYPAAAIPTSNAREMLFVNTDVVGTQVANPAVLSALAHEFQHMIRHAVDANEDAWMDEGFSVLTQALLGGVPERYVSAFMDRPETQVNYWTLYDEPVAAHYGAAYLLLAYFQYRFGDEALRRLSDDPANGLAAFEQALATTGETTLDDFFADWAVANIAQVESTGPYAYPPLTARDWSPRIEATVRGYPFLIERVLAQYTTDYYVLNVPAGASLTLTVDAAADVRVIPAASDTGGWFWYSQRGDDADTTLTRAFDLTGVDAAQLTYRVWYDIEVGWDYAYVMVSTDGGATWTPLQASGTRTVDPFGNAYGPGYTGQSGGWAEASADLSAYAGQTVLVRFEMITDSAVNFPGIAIDDVAVDAVGYFADFETDGGGWEAAGWARIDNRLPQQIWLQIIMENDDGVMVERRRVMGTESVTIAPDGETVTVTISPFAPVTTVPARYTLRVTAGDGGD